MSYLTMNVLSQELIRKVEFKVEESIIGQLKLKEKEVSSGVDWAMDIAKLVDSTSQNLEGISKELISIGQQVTKTVFDTSRKNKETILKVNEFLENHQSVDIIVKTEKDCWIPWELLYLGSNSDSGMNGFLGYKRNIYRNYKGDSFPKTCLKSNQELDIGFVEYQGNGYERLHISDEFKIFENFKGKNRLERVKFESGISLENLHILHFTGLIVPFKYLERSKILISEDEWLPMKLKESSGKRLSFKNSPLIVLNARDNHFRNPRHIFKWATKTLLHEKAGAVIASEFPVSPELARDFAKKFYGYLFDDKMSIDQALARAKTDLVDQNPFAMFYVPYFQPTANTEKQKLTMKKILVLAANPKGTSQLRLDEEIREIENGLQRAKKREQFELRQKLAVRVEDLRREMLDFKPDFVHFCGHGSEGNLGIILEGDAGESHSVGAEPLANFFKLFAKYTNCILLNACYSSEQAESIAKHINYVIGMAQAISDKAAIEFSVAFYDAIGAGENIEFAYELACNAIEMKIKGSDHLIPKLHKK